MAKIFKAFIGIFEIVIGVVLLTIPGWQGIGAALLAMGLNTEAKVFRGSPNSGWRGESQAVSLSSDEPRKALVGTSGTPGSLVTWQTWGNNNEYIIILFALYDHKCDSLLGGWWAGKAMTINGDGSVQEAYADGRHNLWVTFYNGDWNQSADAELIANAGGRWTSNDRGRGVCYIKVKARYSEKGHPNGLAGLFQFSWNVKGGHWYDRRLDSTAGGSGSQRANDASTWAYTDNATVAGELILRGISVEDTSASVSTRARDVFYGLGLTSTYLPFADNVASMNACDESVSLKAGGTEKRYRVAGTIACTTVPQQALEDVCTAMAGKLVVSTGKWRLIAGVAQTPIRTIVDGDLRIDGPHRFVRDIASDQLVNAIYARFADPNQQFAVTPLPARLSAADEAEDFGRKQSSYDLNLVPSQTQGQRVMEIYRRQARRQKRSTITLPPRHLDLEAADWLNWDSDRYGALLTWEIGQGQLKTDEQDFLSLVFDLIQTDSDVYTWNPAVDELDPLHPTLLPSADPVIDTITGLVVTEIIVTDGSSQIPGLTFQIDAPVDPLAVGVLFEWRVVGLPDGADATYSKMFDINPVTDTGTLIFTVTEGVSGGLLYEARARLVTRPEKPSSFTAWEAASDATSGLTADQIAAGIGKNCLLDSDFRLGTAPTLNYWRFFATNTSNGQLITSTNGVRWLKNTRVDESASEYLAITNDNQFGSLPITPGTWMEFQAVVGGANLSSITINAHWYTAAGVQIGSPVPLKTITSYSAGLGELDSGTKVGAFAQAPAGAYRCALSVVGVISTAVGAYVCLTQPMQAKALPDQTKLSPWNPGVNGEPGADVTGAHTAANIANQGSMATKNIFRQSTQPSSGMVSGDIWVKTGVTPNQVYQYDQSSGLWVKASPTVASEILYGSGATIESLKPAEASADVTGGHTAANITGQGTMATKNIFRQGTQPSSGMVSGDLWIKNNVTPNQVFQYDQSTTTWVKASASVATEILYGSGVTIESLKPGEAAADVTGGHTAANISGQGTFATRNVFRQGSAPSSGMATNDIWIKNNVTPNQVYQYDGSAWQKATPSASTEIKYSDGFDLEVWKPASTSADQTSSRTAAAIANQGTMATKNIFRQNTAPTSGMVSGDLWIKTTGTRLVYQYDQSSSTWVAASAAYASDLIHDATGVSLGDATQYFNGQGCIWDYRGLPINGTIGQAAVRNNIAPLSAPSTSQVSVGASTISLPNGSISLGSGSVTGLSADTAYHMFYDRQSLVYLADNSLITSRFTSTDQYLYLGQQRTPVSGTTFTPPNPTPPGGGGVSANYCCSPETNVMLACGVEIPAGRLERGDLLRTSHERTGGIGDYEVTDVEIIESERWRVVLGDGRIIVGSPNHRVFVMGSGWTELQHLSPEAPLVGPRPAFVVDAHPFDVGPVVKITVDSAHTYISDGVLSHNTKYVYY